MLAWFKRYHIFEIGFFVLIFILSIQPILDFDVWFHLKSGEVISQLGLIHYDVFSYNTAGREWFPYEWLFQVGIYQFQRLFGFEAIKYLVAALGTLSVLSIFAIFRKIFRLNVFLSIVISFLFLISIFGFFTPRPHLVAYLLLIWEIFIVLNYFFAKERLSLFKSWLWLTLPITLVWANLHGSIFLDPLILAGYAFVSLVEYLKTREKLWLEKFKSLTIFTVLNAVFTVLPPLGILQYRLLFIFFGQRKFLAQYISEWAPLQADFLNFAVFTIMVVVVLALFSWLLFRKKSWEYGLWALPLLALIPLAYLANRNVFLAFIALFIITGWTLSKFEFKSFNRDLKVLSVAALVFVVGFHLWILSDLLNRDRSYFPVQAAQFIKNYHLQGHMFNEYAFGGYLLYQLYPEQKVFFDGRTDLYLDHEMPDTLDLAMYKNYSDSDYKQVLDALWNKYDISFTVIRTQKNTILRKMARILTDDPDWSLVFWDDNSEIFVRHDHKNDALLKDLAVSAATPYNQDPFRKDQKDPAQKEYSRMISVADSSKSRNALGYIDLLNGDLNGAQTELEKAIALDNTNESPLMNLAEIYAHNGNLDGAVKLYQQAKTLAPDRGLIYIRLGQLMSDNGSSDAEVKAVWQEGLQKTADTDTKQQLQQLLNQP